MRLSRDDCSCAAFCDAYTRYSLSSRLGLSKAQMQQDEKQQSSPSQRLQRLGRLSAKIEQERRETRDLIVGVEDVSNSLGMQFKVFARCSTIARHTIDPRSVLQPACQLHK